MSGFSVGMSTGASGSLTELPADLLHGVALRPPEVLWDGARYRGSALLGVQQDAAQGQPGVAAVVRHKHFAGVVAVTPLYARQAALALAPEWQRAKPDPELHGDESPKGDERSDAFVDTPSGVSSDTDPIRYTLSAQPAAAAGTQVVAWSLNGRTRVWLPACSPDTQALIRQELSALLEQPLAAITVTVGGQGLANDASRGGGANGANGTNGAIGAAADRHDACHPMDLMDAAADAALLSQAVGRPVSVACVAGESDERILGVRSGLLPDAPHMDATSLHAQIPDENVPHPVTGGAGAALTSRSPWALRPSLARLLSQPTHASAAAHATLCGSMPVVSGTHARPPLRASVQELNAAQVFAEESYWHEQAQAQGHDPQAWRLSHLPPGRGQDLAQQVAARAAQVAGKTAPAARAAQSEPDGLLRGTGFATAQVQCVDETGSARTVWTAWVAEVAVQPDTGRIDVTRIVAGHDSQHLRTAQGAPIDTRIDAPDHPRIDHQAPWMLDSARRLLAEPAAFDTWTSPARPSPNVAAGALEKRDEHRDLSRADSAAMRIAQGSLDVDGVVTLPASAAIANAIHDATGVRLRQVPFQAESLRRALAGQARVRNPMSRGWKWLAAGMAGLAGVAVALWPMKPALPLTPGPDVSLYSASAIERGRLVAAAGDCMACHTAAGGKTNAGGLALDTPFGVIYTTNITPDNDTGIGRWSYAAFERAMRQGVHQDGRQLYPAFPYTAYAKLSDADMQALYGYLMSQPAVKAEPPKTQLAFPFNMRPLLAGWNALFHDAAPFTPDSTRSAAWLRGAYLVEGAGHCSACHTPRNRLGAEKTGVHYLAGGEAEGWTAPALNALASGPRAWSSEELFQYLRTGYAPKHGVAAGPMAPVIHGLAELPDSDLRAITTYLMDLPNQGGAAASVSTSAPASAPDTATLYALQARHANGERVYQNACAACHDAGSGPTLFGARPLLGANTNVHAATPDNLIQVILHGIQDPAEDALGYMPAFRDSLNDAQVADLVGYLRQRFAPGEPAWPDPTATIERLRDFSEQH
ncbi:cytochrome C oxidase Cbb3 [Bordetella genomosp. 9]|uniref:Cytochrome C oxidase Cbb3 n=1 Tax=Bordetella genomosp. 9 TaxID=1416803 RepID=A0A261RL99_9BORD|nr:cytochrome c [Bordetella genomosp. 9]OZI25799.1 cytochrome C oxidase Cbb3 [Bordetella genomosp. 9]